MRALKIVAGIIWTGVGAGAAFLAGFALVVFNASPARVEPGQERAAAVAMKGSWGNPSGAVPARDRVIEVVDRISPVAWRVGAAAGWLDKRTTSRMKTVARCSGKAYRCIIVRSGKLSGNTVGWSQGATITIDTGKATRKRYTAADRHLLLVHELGHQFGLSHSTGRNIMNPTEKRWKLALTSGQSKHLRNR